METVCLSQKAKSLKGFAPLTWNALFVPGLRDVKEISKAISAQETSGN